MIGPEQLRQFAEAVGWTHFQSYGNGGGFWHRDGCTKRARNSFCECRGHWTLPDFLHSLDAAIEALEWFCERHDYYAHFRIRPNHCFIQHGDEYPTCVGSSDYTATLNEAIILAVLEAANK